MLLIVTIEEEVFLRSSLFGGGIGGEAGVSFGAVVFRESQAKGLVILLLAVGVGIGATAGDNCGCGAAGGGPHGIEGRTLDKP